MQRLRRRWDRCGVLNQRVTEVLEVQTKDAVCVAAKYGAMNRCCIAVWSGAEIAIPHRRRVHRLLVWCHRRFSGVKVAVMSFQRSECS
jgi:hypothetical protein